METSSAAYQERLAHWNDDRETELLAASIVLISATCLAIAIRFWAQLTIKKQWAPDNIVIFHAAVLAVAVTIACIVAFGNGVGKHLARVAATDPHKPRQMVRALKSAYAIGLLQGPCLGLIKISILLFYRRVFTMHRRTFKIAFHILGTYTILLAIATLVVFILQCLPITFFWDRAYFLEKAKPPHIVKGHCLAQQLHVVTTLIANTVSDVAILVLPAIGLWNLQLPRGTKIGLFGVFSLGAFVTCVGAVRIYYGFKATNTADVSWVNANIMLWTAVECCVGTICASLPPMAPLLKRFKNASSLTSVIWTKIRMLKASTWWYPIRLRQSDGRCESCDEDGNSLQDLRPAGKVLAISAKNAN